MHAPLLKTLLVCTNFSILSFLLFLMIDHMKASYNILSWSSAFHILCICWLIMRGAFWLLTIISDGSWTNVTFYSLYWMPHPFQFGAFMLLPLFFAQVIYPIEWRAYWHFVRPMYILVIFGTVAFQAIWAILKAQSECEARDNVSAPATPGAPVHSLSPDGDIDCFHTDYSSNAFRLVASALFIGLAALQGVYGYLIAYLEHTQYKRFFTAPQQVLNAVNLTLFVSFLTRGLYQLGTVFSLYVLPPIPLQGEDDVSFWVFFCFEIWDYIPTILLILTVTSRSVGSGTHRVRAEKTQPEGEGLPLPVLNSFYQGYGLLSSHQDPSSSLSDGGFGGFSEVEMALLEGNYRPRSGIGARAAGSRAAEEPVDRSSLER